MKLPAGNSSLSGLSGLISLAICTRDMALARDMPNLAAKLATAIEDAERAPSLNPGDPTRTTAFSRLKALQRDAMRAFARNSDTTPPPKDHP